MVSTYRRVSEYQRLKAINDSPEIMKMIRVRSAEESFKSECLRCSTILQGSIEEIREPIWSHKSYEVESTDMGYSLGKVGLGRTISLIVLRVQPCRVEERVW
jgi:hypothetical protein